LTGTLAPPTDFDMVAHVYDESLPPHVVEHYLRKRLAFIRRHATAGPVLDVGCGTGVLLERVTDAGYKAVGLDPSRGMLAQLRARRPEIPSVVGDGAALPFPDETFALVYCVAVLHHVAEETAVRQTLAEMSRVTRRGGHVLIWDHNPSNPYWPWLMRRVPQDTGGERLIPVDEIVAGLAAGGAQPIACWQLGLVPDFTPRRLLGATQLAERLVETAPIVRRLCAHNVILAVKADNSET
jgi:SAM-dependent methyltransferase